MPWSTGGNFKLVLINTYVANAVLLQRRNAVRRIAPMPYALPYKPYALPYTLYAPSCARAQGIARVERQHSTLKTSIDIGYRCIGYVYRV